MNDFVMLLVVGALIVAMVILGVTATGQAFEGIAQSSAVSAQARAVRDVGIAQATAHETISLAQIELTRDLARLSMRGGSGGDPVLSIVLIVVVVLALVLVVFLLVFGAVMLSGSMASPPAPRRALPSAPAVRYLEQDVYIDGKWAPVSRGASPAGFGRYLDDREVARYG